MNLFRPVRRIIVSLWGEKAGVIVPAARQGTYAFRFEKSFLNSGIEISPLMMPLRKEAYAFPDLPSAAYFGLPPVFADSLPDAFGTGLIDHWLREHGIDRTEITPLDRLAYLGRRTMGALTYDPDHGPRGKPTALDIRELADSAQSVLNGKLAAMEGDESLRTIIRLGSSAGGAQAKAIVGWNRSTGDFMLGDKELPQGFEHWIIKFTPAEYPWRGEAEYSMYTKAKKAGVTMSESCLYELDGLKHFMTRRFDRIGGEPVHLATLSALAHLPIQSPPAHLRYEQLFIVADELGLEYEAREQLFRRMAFNCLAGEFDDHPKNFSFCLRKGRKWELAPAYDLTGSDFPETDPWNGKPHCHCLSVNGRRMNISTEDILTVADRFGIGTAAKVLDEIQSACTE